MEFCKIDPCIVSSAAFMDSRLIAGNAGSGSDRLRAGVNVMIAILDDFDQFSAKK
jgi:hypothetical protein